MIIRALMQGHIEAGARDPDQLSLQVWDELSTMAAPQKRTVILQLLLELARTSLRDFVRQQEIEANNRSKKTPRSRIPMIRNGKHVKSMQNCALLEEKIFIPSRGRITWGEATAEDLEARIIFISGVLKTYTSTVAASIDFLSRAREFIVRTKVKCLNEYPDFQPEMIPGFTSEGLRKVNADV